MKSASTWSLIVCLILIVGSGCIPAAPPEPQPEPVKTPATPPPAQPAPAEAPAEAADSPDEEDGISHLSLPLDLSEVPPGALEMPVVSLVRLDDEKGYVLRSYFPVEGLSMEGSLLRRGPSEWTLSGQFKSNTDAFAPEAPAVQIMGTMQPKQYGGLEFVGNTGEVLITFDAPLPPPNAPVLPEPKTIPFSLDFEAPDNALFMIMLMPF